MNSELVKKVSWYILGALVGGYIGSAIADLIIDKMYENEYKPTPEDRAELEEIVKPYSGEEKVELVKMTERKTPKLTVRPTDYTQYNKNRESLEAIVKKRIGEDAAIESTKKNADQPYVITHDRYGEINGHTKVTLTYYEGDDTLCTMDEVIIHEVDQMLGPDALLNFGNGSEDKDIVYICNERTGVDYEVIMAHATYAETVAGIIPEEKKVAKPRRPRANTRKVKPDDDDEEE